MLISFVKEWTRKLLPPCYKNIASWLELLRMNDGKAFPRNNLDDLVNVKSVLLGAQEKFGSETPEMIAITDLCLDAIFIREKEWFDAIVEVREKGKVHLIDALKL